MTSGSLAKAVNYLVRDPVEKRSFGLLLLRLSQLLSERAKGRMDEPLARVLSALKPKLGLPPSRIMDAAAIGAALAKLNQRGWELLPWRFPPDSIAALRRFAFSTPAWARDPRERILISETDPPRDQPRYMWPLADLLRVPALQGLIADSALHDLAQLYLGGRPLLTSITLMLDPAYRGVFDAHVYHYDLDGPRFIKYFVHLTDVDADSGAHAYIGGSHGHHKPPQLQRAARYDREKLLSHYGSDSEVVFAVQAGTVLAEDTAGFHRGTTPKAGYRLLLQLEYGLMDIPHEVEFVSPIARAKIEGLDPAIGRIVRKFFV